MSSNAWALQKAVYSAQTNDAGLMTLISGVHDDPQGSDALPYLVIGDDTTIQDGTKTNQHYQHTLTFHIYAEANSARGANAGRKGTKLIMAAVEAAIDRKSLVLQTGTLSEIRWEFSESFKEKNGETYHGVMRCRAFTNSE